MIVDEIHLALLGTIHSGVYHVGGQTSQKLLDAAIRQVSDIGGSHQDIRWNVRFGPGSRSPLPPSLDEQGTLDFIKYERSHVLDKEKRGGRIKRLMKQGRLELRHTLEHLMATSKHEEGLENYVYAFSVIGPGTNTCLDDDFNLGKPSKSPTIFFDVRDERATLFVIKNEVTSRVITCSEQLKASYRLTDEQVFRQLVDMFEWRVWLTIGILYPGVGLLFGLLYCCVARCTHGKNKSFPKYLSAPPFRVGLWALINQVEDRSVNGKPFGFMAWVVGLQLLVAVVLNQAFRGTNLLSFGSSRLITCDLWGLLTPARLQAHNLSVCTDD